MAARCELQQEWTTIEKACERVAREEGEVGLEACFSFRILLIVANRLGYVKGPGRPAPCGGDLPGNPGLFNLGELAGELRNHRWRSAAKSNPPRTRRTRKAKSRHQTRAHSKSRSRCPPLRRLNAQALGEKICRFQGVAP